VLTHVARRQIGEAELNERRDNVIQVSTDNIAKNYGRGWIKKIVVENYEIAPGKIVKLQINVILSEIMNDKARKNRRKKEKKKIQKKVIEE